MPKGVVSSSLPRNSGAAPHPIILQASLAALNEPPLFNEMWEPPTRAEWRRAVRILALQAVRHLLHGGAERRLLRALEPPGAWH
jgi:hypothetical protein